MAISSNWKLGLALLVLAIVVVGVIFAQGNFGSEERNETIKIGAMLALSGEASAWGESSQRAIDLAVEEVNSNGGIDGKKVEVVYADTKGDPNKGVSAYRKLKNIDNVDAIIGPNLQSVGSSIAPLADEDGMPVVSPAFVPRENRPNLKNPLMSWLNPSVEAGEMAEYVYSNQSEDSVAVLGTQDAWEKEVSNSFSDRFDEVGGEVTSKQLVNVDDSNVRTPVSKAIDDNPDAVFLGTYYKFLDYGRALKEQGYEGDIYSIELDDYLIGQSKGFSDGLEYIGPARSKESFREKYEEKYDEESSVPAPQTYDAAKILFSLLENSSSKEDLIEDMQDFESYEGVSGKIEFDEMNRTVMPMEIYRINNGSISKIKGIGPSEV